MPAEGPTKAPRVAICIATYRRPEGLRRLLDGIGAQVFDDWQPEVRIIVVDNDAKSTGTEQIVEEFRDSSPWPIVLERESIQGISYARNCGLDAVGNCDFVALIDDDEAPAPEWLEQLLATQDRYDADVVRGPVVPLYEVDPEQWIVEGRFFERPRYPTGTALHVAYTHNVLFRWLPFGRDYRFSPRYARSGGSDSHYFGRLHKDGASIVFSDEAVVYEWQPATRLTAWWIARRMYRIGLSRVSIDSDLRNRKHPRVRSAWEACRRLAMGSAGLARHARGPTHERIKAMSVLASGIGRVAGLAGLWYEEYRPDSDASDLADKSSSSS